MLRVGRLFSFLLTFFILASFAEAHGPTRQKVTETIEIDAPADKVWARIGNFHDMSWHPAVDKTEGTGENEVQSIRVITLKGGQTVTEELSKYSNEKMSYSYRITQVDVKVIPVNNYSSTITVKLRDGGGSLVVWRGAFYRGFPNNNPPPELNEAAAIKAVNGIYRSGLENLKKLIEAAQ